MGKGSAPRGLEARLGLSRRRARAVTHVLARFAIPALFLAPLITLVVRYSLKAGDLLLHVLTPVAICAWALAITKMTVDGLRSPETPEKIAFRKRLAAARNYFIAQLRSREPRLRDEWYPYALAFGLGKHVERWFGAHGNASGSSSITSSATPSSSSSGGGWSWSGGGGAFGGAGSTGGWALAAGTLAAGVSAPSSGGSGGGSSSSSSSSSSGGGGGGGW